MNEAVLEKVLFGEGTVLPLSFQLEGDLRESRLAAFEKRNAAAPHHLQIFSGLECIRFEQPITFPAFEALGCLLFHRNLTPATIRSRPAGRRKENTPHRSGAPAVAHTPR
jgi:hypothetical protein